MSAFNERCMVRAMCDSLLGMLNLKLVLNGVEACSTCTVGSSRRQQGQQLAARVCSAISTEAAGRSCTAKSLVGFAELCKGPVVCDLWPQHCVDHHGRHTTPHQCHSRRASAWSVLLSVLHVESLNGITFNPCRICLVCFVMLFQAMGVDIIYVLLGFPDY